MKLNVILAWATLTAAGASGAVPFYDGFDASALYGPGTNFLTPINGWGSGSTNVQVTDDVCDTAPNSARIVGPEILSNSVGGATGQIWTDCRMLPVFGSPPDLTSNATASLAGYFMTNGLFAYATSGGWVACPVTVWGGSAPTLTEGQFVRITVYQDYVRSNSAVFINSNLVAQDIRFYGNSPAYRAFLAQGGDYDTTSHWDTVGFSNGPPPDITTDANNDGNHDVDEMALYGYAMRYLGVATNATYTNVQMAVGVARARDVIVVADGIYAGNVAIDHDVTITGGSFTNTGGLNVSAGVTVSMLATGVFDNASVTGTVDLGGGGLLTVTGSLGLAASGVIQAAGGGLVSASPNVVLGGTFTVNGSNWNNAAAQSTVPFNDGFELYGVGTSLANYPFNGWGASTPAVQVEAETVAVGAKAVLVADGSAASNRVNGEGFVKIWTDVRIWPVLGVEPVGLPTNASTCLLYFNSNGYVVVYNPTNGWEVCTSNANRQAVTNLASASRFVRMTVCTDFSKRESAAFLDGELLRERVPFGSGAASAYRRLMLDNQDGGSAHLDEVSVRVTPPGDLYGNIDGDGANDVREIDLYGTLFNSSGGVVIKFR